MQHVLLTRGTWTTSLIATPTLHAYPTRAGSGGRNDTSHRRLLVSGTHTHNNTFNRERFPILIMDIASVGAGYSL